MDSKTKHDFTNNCLRIEILQKLLMENLDTAGRIPREHLKDYKTFLKEQLELAEALASENP